MLTCVLPPPLRTFPVFHDSKGMTQHDFQYSINYPSSPKGCQKQSRSQTDYNKSHRPINAISGPSVEYSKHQDQPKHRSNTRLSGQSIGHFSRWHIALQLLLCARSASVASGASLTTLVTASPQKTVSVPFTEHSTYDAKLVNRAA